MSFFDSSIVSTMAESIEIAVDLQLSPCGTKIEDATSVQGFNGILADFVSDAIEQSDDLPSGDFSVGGRIASQSILRQDGIWSRMGRFFRKFYTKRRPGDPVGRSRVEVKEILTLSFNNSTADAVADAEEGLSQLITDSFADGNSTDQIRSQLLASNDTNSFFSYPVAVEVVTIRQNRYAGVKLAPLLGSIGVVVLVLAFIIRFSPRRWRKKAGNNTSEYTSHSSLPPPELIDISNDLSSIGVHSPASVFYASQEAKARRMSEPAAMVQQELPPIPEEPGYDLERGLPHKYCPERPTRSQAYPPNNSAPQDLKPITVVVGAGYPEDLGFTIWPGPDALEIKEVLGDSRLPLRVGDMIVEVDGRDASRWKPADFEEYLFDRRRHHKTLLIARRNRISRDRSDRDHYDETYLDDEATSYVSDGYETDCEDMLSRFDEVMFDDPAYYE